MMDGSSGCCASSTSSPARPWPSGLSDGSTPPMCSKPWAVNHKRVYRLYSEEGLSIRTKLPRRKRAWRYRAGRPEITAPNHTWAMDFMSDALFDGRPFRLLTVVDCCSREGLATV